MRTAALLFLLGLSACALGPSCADLSADVGVSYARSTGPLGGSEVSTWVVVPVNRTAVDCTRGK